MRSMIFAMLPVGRPVGVRKASVRDSYEELELVDRG
jgi:hypothetical protein